MKFPTNEEWVKIIVENALDNYEYKGKTLRRWIDIISAQDTKNIDLISRKEAIEYVKNIEDVNKYYHPNSRTTYKITSTDEVIDLLEQVPTYIAENNYNSAENNDKLVSQKAVLDMLNKIDKAVDDGEGYQYKEWVDYVEELPTITQTDSELEDIKAEIKDIQPSIYKNYDKHTAIEQVLSIIDSHIGKIST